MSGEGYRSVVGEAHVVIKSEISSQPSQLVTFADSKPVNVTCVYGNRKSMSTNKTSELIDWTTSGFNSCIMNSFPGNFNSLGLFGVDINTLTTSLLTQNTTLVASAWGVQFLGGKRCRLVDFVERKERIAELRGQGMAQWSEPNVISKGREIFPDLHLNAQEISRNIEGREGASRLSSPGFLTEETDYPQFEAFKVGQPSDVEAVVDRIIAAHDVFDAVFVRLVRFTNTSTSTVHLVALQTEEALSTAALTTLHARKVAEDVPGSKFERPLNVLGLILGPLVGGNCKPTLLVGAQAGGKISDKPGNSLEISSGRSPKSPKSPKREEHVQIAKLIRAIEDMQIDCVADPPEDTSVFDIKNAQDLEISSPLKHTDSTPAIPDMEIASQRRPVSKDGNTEPQSRVSTPPQIPTSPPISFLQESMTSPKDSTNFQVRTGYEIWRDKLMTEVRETSTERYPDISRSVSPVRGAPVGSSAGFEKAVFHAKQLLGTQFPRNFSSTIENLEIAEFATKCQLALADLLEKIPRDLFRESHHSPDRNTHGPSLMTKSDDSTFLSEAYEQIRQMSLEISSLKTDNTRLYLSADVNKTVTPGNKKVLNEMKELRERLVDLEAERRQYFVAQRSLNSLVRKVNERDQEISRLNKSLVGFKGREIANRNFQGDKQNLEIVTLRATVKSLSDEVFALRNSKYGKTYSSTSLPPYAHSAALTPKNSVHIPNQERDALQRAVARINRYRPSAETSAILKDLEIVSQGLEQIGSDAEQIRSNLDTQN